MIRFGNNKMATLRYKDKEIVVEAGKTVEQALRELGFLPDTVLVIQGRKIVPPTHRLSAGEELEILTVISGG